MQVNNNMYKKLNAYIAIFILMFSMVPVNAAPNIYNREVPADVGLSGLFFTDIDPSNIMVKLLDSGSYNITSTDHVSNVTFKIKQNALDSRFKGYDGSKVAITHYADDGSVDHYVVELKPDIQGFAYLTVDLSTVIVSGFTGYTTQSYTNQSGNQSFSVPNGTSYDVEITNHQEGVYSVNGYDWDYQLPFYQNSSVAFNDTQYELNNTNFQINATVFNHIETDGNGLPIVNFTLNGSNIPFFVTTWGNESNFSLYTNSTSGIENLSLNVYYGGNDGLSSGSSIQDTFVKGDDFSDDSLDAMWDNMNSRTWTESSGSLSVTNTGGPSTLKVDLPISDFIVEVDIKPNTINSDKRFGIGARYAANGFGYSVIHSHSSVNPSNTKVQIQRDGAEFGTDYTLPFTVTAGTWYTAKLQIVGNTQKGKWWVKGTSEPASWDMSQTYSTLSNNNAGLFGGQATGNDINYDNFRVLKYTATELTYTIIPEQQLQGTTNITASITGDSNTQQYNTSQSREFSLTPTGYTDELTINTTSTDYDITITTYWQEDTTRYEQIDADNGYFYEKINYTPSHDVSLGYLTDTIGTDIINFNSTDYIGTATVTGADSVTLIGQEINATVSNLIAGNSYWINITIPYNNIPTVSEIQNQSAYVDVPEYFTKPSFIDPEGYDFSSIFWNFGDGNTSQAHNPVHTYTSPGTYTANCTITETATVSPHPVTVEFTVIVATMTLSSNKTITFIDPALGDPNTKLLFFYENGTSAGVLTTTDHVSVQRYTDLVIHKQNNQIRISDDPRGFMYWIVDRMGYAIIVIVAGMIISIGILGIALQAAKDSANLGYKRKW